METKEKMIKNLVDVGYKARKEAEDFLNRWLNDRTKGWAVQSDLVNRDEDRFSASLTICFN